METTTGEARRPVLGELVDVYLTRCRVEGKSPHTIRAYRETLGKFVRALAEDGAPTDAGQVRAEHLYRYMDRFSSLTLDSRHRYLREVLSFFNWLVQVGYVEVSPFKNVRNVRLPKKVVRPFGRDDVQTLLSACPDTAVGKRDQAILTLLLDTGLRVSELTGLNLQDIDLDDMRLIVLRGKGNKQRVVAFSRSCRDTLNTYLAARGDAHGPLFYGTIGRGGLKPGTRLHANGVKHMMRRLSARTGVPRVYPHRFRHTFATWAIEQGARELDVQLLLGHSTPDMVRRYAATYNVEQAARRHASFSPLLMISAEP